MKKKVFKHVIVIALTAILAVLLAVPAVAAVVVEGGLIPDLTDTQGDVGGGPGSRDPNINISLNGDSSDTVRIILLMTVLSLLPSFVMMMTCFTRIVIVFSLLRNAMGLQQTPPNQVLIGLALFLTLFIMQPVITEINDNAYKPYSDGDITTTEFLERAKGPLREFMLKQTQAEDLNLFLTLANKEVPTDISEYTMEVVIPAFITSEMKRAFVIGFMLYVPFLLIDMVVSSALMSMGMMMLPPVTISMPFKLLLFIMVDGWGLLIKTLVLTYQ